MRHSMAALTSSRQGLRCTWGVLGSFLESCRIWCLLSQDTLSLDVFLMGMLASWRVLTKHLSRLASQGLPPAPDTNNQGFECYSLGLWLPKTECGATDTMEASRWCNFFTLKSIARVLVWDILCPELGEIPLKAQVESSNARQMRSPTCRSNQAW